MPVDKFLVGNFRAPRSLHNRWAPRVKVSYINDDFTKNILTVLCEKRVALAVKNRLALVYSAFGFLA